MLALLALAPQPAVAQVGTVVKIYSCPPGTAPAYAERLRNEFAVVPGVRIAADERTSQIVVQAPAEVQTPIGQRLAALLPGGGRSTAAGVNGTAAAAPVSRSVSLHHLTPQQLESSLWSMLGSRLSAIPAGPDRARRYQLVLAGGGLVKLALYPADGRTVIEGASAAVDACVRLIQVLDGPADGGSRSTQVVPLRASRPASIQQAAAAILKNRDAQSGTLPMVVSLFQPRPEGSAPGAAAKPPAAPGPAAQEAPAATGAPPPAAKPDGAKSARGLTNPVQIELLDGLDVLVIRGNRSDVDQVVEVINQIERLSTETEPSIEFYELKHVDCMAIGILLRSLYDEVFLSRQGNLSITPLVKPNALLLVGRRENVQRAIDLIGRLDQPVAPHTQFRVFPLRHASAAAAQMTIQQFFLDRGGLSPQVRATADMRSNSLIVQAAPRDMAEVAELIRRIDVGTSAAVNELRIIPLEHTMAQDLATILQSAIGAATAAGRPMLGAAGVPGYQVAAAPAMPQAGAAGDQRSVVLRFLTIDAKGQRLLSSGILSDVRITPDLRANALVVSAPAESMELLEALIRQLDKLPSAEAQIKVFTIVNGDALNLADMLRTLFASQAYAGMPMSVLQGGAAVNSVVTLRFAVDSRTNSIIASGSMGDLNVVEAILMRLDDSEVRHRRSLVFRLKNSPANDVARAINEFLRTERQVQQLAPGLVSAFEQIEHEVVVVPEPVSNSLILSATPRFFEEISKLIEQLDARPPMVMIQVLIAEVQLGNTSELGVEIGLQDAVLFDRSILSNIQTISTTETPSGQPQITTQHIVAADNKPGFGFNNLPLGNSGADKALATAARLGSQGLSNFAVGRTNNNLGFGGLVLSASSESINVLLRALCENHRVDILQRPQIMTLDNQPAFIQVGQRVPRITGTQVNQIGQANSVTLENVGLILGVTPRISPDGLVVMEIDAEKSELGAEAEGIPVAISEGQVIRSPRINTTTAQTTVSALNGQTVVLGGLIAKTTNEFHRKVPMLGDLPLVGRLFRYDGTSTQRQELLIIMTPHVVRNEADADVIKRTEAARMNWCLSDVTAFFGEAGLRKRTDAWSEAEIPTIYPDENPALPTDPKGGRKPETPELVPTPQGVPERR